MIDLEPLKTVLAEYDPNAPRCPLKVEYQYYDLISHEPCCRREGHDGECNNLRPSFGWPGYVTITALVAEVERLHAHRESCTENLLKGYETGKTEERAAVVAFLRQEANAPHPSELDTPMLSPSGRGLLLLNASAIERGDHRRKGDE